MITSSKKKKKIYEQHNVYTYLMLMKRDFIIDTGYSIQLGQYLTANAVISKITNKTFSDPRNLITFKTLIGNHVIVKIFQ